MQCLNSAYHLELRLAKDCMVCLGIVYIFMPGIFRPSSHLTFSMLYETKWKLWRSFIATLVQEEIWTRKRLVVCTGLISSIIINKVKLYLGFLPGEISFTLTLVKWVILWVGTPKPQTEREGCDPLTPSPESLSLRNNCWVHAASHFQTFQNHPRNNTAVVFRVSWVLYVSWHGRNLHRQIGFAFDRLK